MGRLLPFAELQLVRVLLPILDSLREDERAKFQFNLIGSDRRNV